MANDRFQYTLAFTADTKQAKTQMKELQSQISSLINTANTKTGQGLLSSEISKASTAAAQLKVQLQDATNATTGKLDLTKFNQSLQKSGLKISDYRKSLMALGPEGEQAFANLATSISQADMPMLRLSAKAKDLVNTLSNTVKWQISSSAIHGFMGAVQGAYGYAQDLNKSLNDIRIVTGQSTDEMAKFAKQANNAAKALSTSTTKYTEAALIYYQQGLTDEQVKARTDTTIKMANVTGENAADVSSYMTAIWNNFAEGSDNLEYFSDVITALGAATAASSEEIAGGLEKFAAVGETVGLSYEYATAALTTIIDKTRQSEDVVGTALKTIFARIQGLQQGETAEDGVTLNKYSNALANVGIQIIDANGNLKDMDKILDELGQKWTTLSKAEQVALAQTVGGTRQYTQLIALMDNWDAMQENLNTAYNSEGALQEQADIYAESWEAAQKRVTAALQDIYDSLLNDKFFIGINNMFASTLNIFGDLIDGFGGFKGILITIGTIAVKYFKGNILSSIESVRDLLFSFTEKGRDQVLQLKKDANKELTKMQDGKANTTGYMIGSAYSSQASMQDELLLKSKDLTAEQEKIAQILLDQHKTLVANVVEEGKLLDKAEKKAQLELRKGQLADEKRGNANWDKHAEYKAAVEQKSAFDTFQNDIFNEVEIKNNATDEEKNNLIERAKKIRDAYKQQYVTKNKEGKEIDDSSDAVFGTIGQNKMKAFNEAVEAGDYEKIVQEIKNMSDATKDFNQNIKESRKGITVTNEMTESYKKAGEATGQVAAETLRANANAKTFGETLGNFVNKNATKFQNGLLGIAQSLGQVAMIINGFNSLSSAWNMEEDISLTERLTRSASALAMILPAAVGLIKSLTSEIGMDTLAKAVNIITTTLFNKALFTTKVAGTGAAEGMMLFKLSIIEIVGAVLIITAAIAAFAFILKELYEWINKDKIALEKANKELENSKKAADEAASAYNDLKSSIDSLESAQDTLKGLTKGTLEWQEAVLKVNEQVLNLIDKYPELAKYMTNTDGVLGISEEGLNTVLQQQANKASALQQAYMSDQRNVASLKNSNKSDKRTLSYIESERTVQQAGASGNAPSSSQTVITTKTISNKVLKNLANNLKLDEKGNIKVEETLDAAGIKNASDALKEALGGSLQKPLLDFKNNLDQANSEIRRLDENIAKTWLINHGSKASSEYNDFLAKGMSKEVGSIKAEYEKYYNLNSEQTREAFAKMTLGPNAGESEIKAYVQQLEKDKIDIKTLQESLISNAANQKAFEKVNERIKNVEKDYAGKDGYSTIRNIIASGGDASSFNALNGQQYEDFKNLVFDKDGKMKQTFQDIFNKTDIFGEGFVDNLTKKFSEANKKAYEDEAAINQERIFSQKSGQRASELGVDEEALEAYAKHLQEINPELKENAEAALDAAEANIRWNNGIEKLSEVLKDNEEALKPVNEGTWDYYEALGKVEEAASDLLGIDVSTDYIEDHLDDLKKAINGDENAIRELQKTAAADWGKEFAESVSGVTKQYEDLNGEMQTFDGFEWGKKFTSALDEVNQILGERDFSFDFDIDANTDKALTSLVNLTNEALLAGEMTEKQMNDMFSSMGYSPEVTYVPGPGQSFTDAGTFTVGNPDSPFHMSIPYSNTYTSSLMVPQIKDSDSDSNKTVSFTKVSTPKNLAKTATPTKKGGGGGSKKDKKKASDEIERYHEIKETIQSLEKELDRLSKAKDRAFGQEKLELMDKEIAKTEELKAAQEKYLKQIRENYNKDRAAAASVGAKFDEQGNISNWEEIRKKALDKFNKSGRTDKDEEEYNRIKKILDQYEETHDLLMDEEDKLDDYINQITEAKVAKIQYKVEVKIEIEETELKYLDYLLGNLEDKEWAAAERMKILGTQTQSWLDKYNTYVKELYDYMNTYNISSLEDAIGIMTGSYSQEQIDKLGLSEDAVKNLQALGANFISTAEGIKSVRDAFTQELLDAIAEGVESFDKLGDKIDHTTNTLEHYKNIIDIIGEDALGVTTEQVADLVQTTIDSAITSMNNELNNLKTLQDERDQIYEKWKNATGSEKEQWAKALEDLDTRIREAQANSQASLEEVLNMITKQFKLHVKQAADAFEEAMSGTFGNLDALQEAFDRQKTLDDMYIDDYKQIYELTKLTRDITRSMDEMDGVKGKQALRDLQKEINDLQKEGVKLSEYDLNHLRAKYELELAQIALEEAQNAKTQVRMTRDSEGNWSYTYTADEDSIANAEQAYEDKLYAMQEMNQEYIKNLEGQLIQSMSAMSKAIQDLGPNATQEQIQATMDFYRTQQNQIQQQMQNALGDGKDIWNYMKDYNTATGYGITANENWVDSFDETQFSILTGFETIEDYQTAFGNSVNKMMDGIGAAFDKYNENLKKAGLDTENWGKKLSEILNGKDGKGGVKKDINDLGEESKKLSEKVTKNVGDALTSLATFYDTYGKAIEDATGKTWGLVDAIKALMDAEKNKKEEDNNKKDEKPKEEPKDNGQNTPELKVGSSVDVKSGTKWYGNSSGGGSAGTAHGGKIVKIQEGATHPYNIDWMGWVKKSDLVGFETGGYTGLWGSAGKVAMLHEKELVLNAQDTENMLKSIEMVRLIVQAIDLNSGSTLGWGGLNSMGVGNGKSEIVQDITINAEFPNATDQDEIKAAFDSLFIRASQYANRK